MAKCIDKILSSENRHELASLLLVCYW